MDGVTTPHAGIGNLQFSRDESIELQRWTETSTNLTANSAQMANMHFVLNQIKIFKNVHLTAYTLKIQSILSLLCINKFKVFVNAPNLFGKRKKSLFSKIQNEIKRNKIPTKTSVKSK